MYQAQLYSNSKYLQRQNFPIANPAILSDVTAHSASPVISDSKDRN